MRERLPERWQVSRDLEEVREQAVGLPKRRAFQAEGTINATVLAWKLLGMLLNVKESCNGLGLARSSHRKGPGAAISVSPSVCGHPHL